MASITIQAGAYTICQSATTLAPGIQSDGALINNGTASFNIGGTGVTTASASNNGILTLAGGSFSDSGTFSNNGTTTITGGAFTVSGTFSNANTLNMNSSIASLILSLKNTGTVSINASLSSNGTLGGGLTITQYPEQIGLTNSGTVNVNANATLQTSSDISNTGTISISGVLTGQFQLQGGGTVVLSGGTINGATSINIDVTVAGHGNLSLFGNNGVVEATGGTLTIASDPIINNNLLEASGSSGTLAIDHIVLGGAATGVTLATGGGTVRIDANGTVGNQMVSASGAGSVVLIGGTVEGSTLETSAGGIIDAAGGLLDGTSYGSVTNAGAIDVAEQSSGAYSLRLQETIVHSGTITVGGSSAEADLAMAGATTLQGGGTVALTGGSLGVVTALGASDTLTNVDNTISGAGQIRGLIVANDAAGTIDADGGSQALTIAAGAAVTNAGLMEATDDENGDGGTLVIAGSVQNAGGTIAAYQDGTVDITGTVTSGILQCSNAGDVVVTGTVGGTTLVQTGGSLLIDGSGRDPRPVRLSHHDG